MTGGLKEDRVASVVEVSVIVPIDLLVLASSVEGNLDHDSKSANAGSPPRAHDTMVSQQTKPWDPIVFDGLLKRRKAAEDRYNTVEAELHAAILAGDDEAVRRLRETRQDAAEEADDLGEVLKLAERQEAVRQAAERARQLFEARTEARTKAEAFERTTTDVDAALSALEAAVSHQAEAANDLNVALLAAGLSDHGRAHRWMLAAFNAALLHAALTTANLTRATLPLQPIDGQWSKAGSHYLISMKSELHCLRVLNSAANGRRLLLVPLPIAKGRDEYSGSWLLRHRSAPELPLFKTSEFRTKL